ncbi:MAG: hypothetical protein JNK05_31935 [Myxococcales bacterium]|nr:hypothetical protein [Myxococcales bacterium]
MSHEIAVRGPFRLTREREPGGGPPSARVRWRSFSATALFLLALVSLSFVGVTALELSLLAQLFRGTYETLLTLLCVTPVFVIMALGEWVVLGKVFNRASVVLRAHVEPASAEGYRAAASAPSAADRVEMRVAKGPFALGRGESWTMIGVRRIERRVSRGARGTASYPVYAVFVDGSERCVDSFEEADGADALVGMLEVERDRIANARS